MSRQIEVEKPKKHTRQPNHDDPQIPQPDLRFARGNSKTTRTINQTQKKGPEPKQNTHKIDLPRDTRFDHCISLKNMRQK